MGLDIRIRFDECKIRDSRLKAEMDFVAERLSGYFPTLDEVADVQPKQDHFLYPNSEIHGIGHVTRVLVLSEILARLYNVMQRTNGNHAVDLAPVRRAAMAHDYGRVNDGYDPEHGTRSSVFYLDTLAVSDVAGVDHELVAYSITWHVPFDDEAPYMTPELQILKDADGLDRVRVAHIGQGTRPDLLRTAHAPFLITTAEYLFRLSNAVYLSNGHDKYSAVMAAAKIMGLVQDKSV